MDKRDLILEHSLELFLEYGVACISMDNIAEKCGISKKTIYKYFESKNDLLLELVRIQKKKLKTNLFINLQNSNALVALQVFFDGSISLLNKMPQGFFRELKRSNPNIYLEILKLSPIICDFLKTNIEKGKKENLFRLDLNAEQLTSDYYTIFEILFTEEHHSSKSKTITFLNHLFAYLLLTNKTHNCSKHVSIE